MQFSKWPEVVKWMRREELYRVQHLMDEFMAAKKRDGSLPTIDTCDVIVGGLSLNDGRAGGSE